MKSHNSSTNKSGPIVAILLFLGCASLVASLSEETPDLISTPLQPSAYSEVANQTVNKHLIETQKELDIKQKSVAVQNRFVAPEVGQSIIIKKDQVLKDYGVDHSADTHEENALNDLNRYQRTISATNPDRIIQNEIYEQDQLKEFNEEYNKQYVEQFLENARAQGYEVKLNSNNVVISVRKIRSPTSSALGPQAQ